MDIDGLFLSKLLLSEKEKLMDAVKNVPVNFLQGEERLAYKWFLKYFRESKGFIPSPKALISKFPNINLVKPKDTLDFYVVELRDRNDYQMLTEGNTRIQNSLFNRDIQTAKDEYRKLGLSLAKNELISVSTVRSNFTERKKKYVENKRLKGKIGYQTGLDAIDTHIGGLVDEMFVIMGRRGVGKTFMLLIMLTNLWKQMNGPLAIITNEISVLKMQGRIDSIMGKFSYSKYRKGLLNNDESKKFINLKDVYLKLPELYVINGAGKAVEQIEMELMAIEGLKGIACDGLYLTDMGKTDEFSNTLAASRSYQQLLQRLGLFGLFTTQMTPTNETKYARAIEEDADMVLKMYRSENMKDSGLMGFEFMKIREEDDDVKFLMDWNFDDWIFRQHISEANKEALIDYIKYNG